jgi:hypothetical protein
MEKKKQKNNELWSINFMARFEPGTKSCFSFGTPTKNSHHHDSMRKTG